MGDKLDMIYDLLKQDREDASDFRKEVRDSHKDTGERLSVLEIQGQVQNQQLQEHIAGVQTLKKLHLDNVKRIEKSEIQIEELKRPAIAMSVLKKWLIGAAAIVTAIATIAKVFGVF